MTYACLETVRALAHPDAPIPADDDRLARLVADAEGDVDLAVGGPRHPDTGRALDPASLTPAQRVAVARAVTRAVEHRALSDVEDLVGADAFAPGRMTLLRPGVSPPTPAIDRELAGHGLIARRFTAPPALP